MTRITFNEEYPSLTEAQFDWLLYASVENHFLTLHMHGYSTQISSSTP